MTKYYSGDQVKEDKIVRVCGNMENETNTYKILVGKPEVNKPIWRPKHRKKDNIKMDIKEKGYKGMKWIHLARNGEK